MRVSFGLTDAYKGWTGGLHYLKNLLYAIDSVSSSDVDPVLFTGCHASVEGVDLLRPYLKEIIQDNYFNKWTFRSISGELSRRVLNRDVIAEALYGSHDIDVVFCMGRYGLNFQFPVVSWIPDFQHVHMPEMFSSKEIRLRDKLMLEIIKSSKKVILSSETAKKDFSSIFPEYVDRVEVMSFVAQIPDSVYQKDPMIYLHKYNLPEKFYFFPSQFWKHKNHLLVIKALQLLKNMGHDIFVVCTGSEHDYRNPEHFNFLKTQIAASDLERNMILLGVVPIEHLYALMRQSVAVLNPSLFEGWSTTVEEAKSLGKSILLSNISVHREQNPPGGVFFDPLSPKDLTDNMLKLWGECSEGPDFNMENNARYQLKERTSIYGNRFADIVKKA